MEKRSIKLLIFFLSVFFLILSGFSSKGVFGREGILNVGCTGLLMALSLILLAVSKNAHLEELVCWGKEHKIRMVRLDS
ncbi:MAG TPA: hypothetical protein C5S37_05435 [Methanophagales archaeon]|nr:hypothetical protein [Methanophagales archaeon]